MKRATLLLLIGLSACKDLEGRDPDDTGGPDDTGPSDDSDTQDTDVSRAEQIAALTGDAQAGAALFATNCAPCHGASGEGNGVAPPFTDGAPAELDAYPIILGGVDGTYMAGFDGLLTDQEIKDIWTHIASAYLP